MTRALRVMCAVALATAVLLPLACGSGGGGSSPSPKPSGPVVLTLVGEKATKRLTMAELKALPAYEGYAGIKTSVGTIVPPVKWKGVKLTDLAGLVGGISEQNGVTVVAKDGYGMTFSYAQAHGREFTTFDPATGDEVVASQPLAMVVAYEREGTPLDPMGEGPLRLVIAQSSLGQVTDGHWAVKWVDRVEVRAASSEWTVNLNGAVRTQITRGSYVNCASPGCHGRSYQDPDGSRWDGVPLWLVVGMVDDANKHGKRAFNAKLAQRGYSIEILTQGGATVRLDAHWLLRHKDVLLSGKLNGGDLPAADFPLRLVGPGLPQNDSVGGILKIVLRLP